MPNLYILYLLIMHLISHHYHLIIPTNVSFRNLLIVYMNLAKHFHLIILQTHNILVELMSFHRNWAVVIKEQVKQWNILSVTVICQSQRFLSDVKHHITEISEKYLWGSVFACFLNFISYIFNLNVNVLETSFSF